MKANRLSKLSRKGCALKILTSLVLNRISFALIFLFSFLPQESCFAYADQKLDPKLLKINTSMQTLERASNGIESEQNIFMERIQEKEKEVARLRQALNDLISQNREIEAYSRVELAKSLEDVTNIWRGSADRLLDLYFSPDFSELALLPDPFLFDSLALKGLPSDIYQSFLEYQKNYENAGLRRKDLVRIRSRLIEEIKARTFHLLNSAGEKRASLLASCDQIDCPRPRGINESNILDIIREFRIVPLKFLSGTLAKWIEIKAKFFSGLDGWIDISRQIILLIILLLIPVGLIFSLDRVSRYLDGWRRNLVAQAVHDRPYYTRLAMWIVRCNPFIPFLGMIVSIEVCQSLLRGTDLRELANFLFYFELYYLYRCFRLLLGLSLDFIFSTSSIGELKNQEIRIEQSAARISRLIFFEYGLLHMTQETVRQALDYH
ncbi:MAG: hypothetical protein KDD35_10005, partial [Bdellovibrionales bacterium]|nr:hypothetical protein [Bdellovibrionales bacterium]